MLQIFIIFRFKMLPNVGFNTKYSNKDLYPDVLVNLCPNLTPLLFMIRLVLVNTFSYLILGQDFATFNHSM